LNHAEEKTMNATIFVVHVQGAAVDRSYTYTGERQMAAYRKLAEICQQVGLAQAEMFSLGYDDVSFEVATQADAVQACNVLNKVLPRSKSKMGYGYGSTLAATAQAYEVTDGTEDYDRYSSPAGWSYGLDYNRIFNEVDLRPQ
jgi:hypothetical protein